MAIFYSPNPSAQPSTSLSQYSIGDYFSVNGAPVVLGSGKLGRLWSKYTTSPLIPTSGAPSYLPPPLTSTTLITTKQLDVGQAVSLNVGSAYGGAAVATSYTSAGTFVGFNYNISPTLPAGLTLSKVFSVITLNGNLYNNIAFAITGSPTTSTPLTSYTITVTDATGLSASLAFSLETRSFVSILTLTKAITSKTATVGVAESGFTPVTATGGSGALTYTIAPPLPTGFNFNATTGQITGTGTAASPVTTYTVTVKDSSSPIQSKSETFSLSVDSIPIVIKTVVPTKTLQQGIVATTFTPITATGGTGT